MFCNFCGNQLNSGDKFCSKCGTGVINTAEVNTMNNSYASNANNQLNNNVSQNKSKKTLIIVLVVVGVFLLSVGLAVNYCYNLFIEFIEDSWNINVDDQDDFDTFDGDEFVASNVKEYYILGYMDYNVPDCWVYNDSMSASLQYKSDVYTFKDNVSMLTIKAGTLMENKSELERYNYFKDEVIKAYGSIRDEDVEYFNNKKWYVITTNQYNHPYGTGVFYNKVYFTFSSSASNIYYLEAYINNNLSDKEYLEDSIEYIINSAELSKLDY